MKKHLSVFMLTARSSVYGLLGVLAAMALVQGVLFYVAYLDSSTAVGGLALINFELLISKSGAQWSFAACFLPALALLCRSGCNFGSKSSYTLRRLSVSEKSVFFYQAFYNCVCLTILWAAQLGVMLLLFEIYSFLAAEGSISGQSAFLAFYRSSFLHSLLPLEEGSRWIRNIFAVIALGLCAALFPYKQRRGKKGWEIIVTAAVCLLSFSAQTGDLGSDVLIIIVCVGFAIKAVISALQEEAEYEY